MRKLLIGACLVAIAAPAAAQPRHHDRRSDEIARTLPSPREIDRMGYAVERFADALMDIDVRPFADAVDPGRRYDGRYGPRTLGDLARRDDPYARERMHDEIAGTTAGLGAATREVAILAPVLRETLLDATRRVDAAVRDSRIRYERERDRRDGRYDGYDRYER